MWTDTHAHLADESLYSILPLVLERAQQAKVDRIVCVAVDLETSRKAIRIAEEHARIWSSAGIHPNYAQLAKSEDWDLIQSLILHPRVCALGETGLDLHWDDCPFDLQQENFARHIQLSFECGLPLIVHMRDCEKEMLRFLRDMSNGRIFRGVMHSFSGTPETACACLEMGFHISFAGMLTYKKSIELRETAKNIPLDRLLVETDCPYLSPEPFRGRRPNEPALVVHTARVLAECKDVSLAELAHATTQNALLLFSKMKVPELPSLQDG